jgi:hypothetical protein
MSFFFIFFIFFFSNRFFECDDVHMPNVRNICLFQARMVPACKGAQCDSRVQNSGALWVTRRFAGENVTAIKRSSACTPEPALQGKVCGAEARWQECWLVSPDEFMESV